MNINEIWRHPLLLVTCISAVPRYIESITISNQTKPVISRFNHRIIPVHKIHFQHPFIGWCQVAYLIITEPELGSLVAKSIAVFFPANEEINRPIVTSLDNLKINLCNETKRTSLFRFPNTPIYHCQEYHHSNMSVLINNLTGYVSFLHVWTEPWGPWALRDKINLKLAYQSCL